MASKSVKHTTVTKKRAPRAMTASRQTTTKSSKITVGKGNSKNQNIWTKFKTIPKPLIVGLWLVLFGVIGTKMLFFSGATAFQYVGTHPQATLQPDTSTGRQLKSLTAWNGKIYAGYGDYNKNTGPVSFTPFDPTSNTFAATPEHTADTESVEIWRNIGDKLYAVHVDPKSHNGAAYSVGDTSSGKAVWSNHLLPTMTHVFGLTQGSTPSELFISGSLDEGVSTNEVAKVYRSVDGGATWTESLSVPSRGGFNRMYFVAKLGDKIYAQNLSTADFNGTSPQSAAWVFNGSGWSKTTPIAQTYQPYDATEYAGKILTKSSPYGNSLLTYDGRNTSVVRANTRDYKVHADGYVYALTYYNNDLSVMRTKDLTNWEMVTAAPNNASSLALIGNTVYIGTSDSELYKAEINPLITDTTPPTATLIAPTTSYNVTTANEFAVNASDASSIDKVEFYAGSTLIGSVGNKARNSTECLSIGSSTSCFSNTTKYPGSYALQWSGKGVTAGTYTLKAIAYDIYGNSTETSSVPIVVPEGLYPPDTTAPTVTISSPSSTQRIRKSVSIWANAQDSEQVVYMEARLDGVVVASQSYETTYATLSKRVDLPRGSHTVVVMAKDRAGNISEKEISFTSR